jgi:cytoskeleton protein RodZ
MQNDFIPSDREDKPVGLILKEARESGGLSLDDAVRVTRIGKTYLRALEEGRYDRLPNDAYLKGFLRVYAAYLNLPEDEIVHAYEKCNAEKCLPTDTIEPQTGKKQNRGKIAGIPVKRIYPVAILIALVAVSVFLVIVPDDKNPNDSVNKNSNSENTDVIAGKAVKPADSSPSVIETDNQVPTRKDDDKESVAAKDVEPAANASPLSKGLALKIKVVEDGWLDVTIDDAVTQHYELKSGDLIEWKADRNFTLDISNAGGLEAEFNGKRLKHFGKIGESAHIVLNAGGIQD